MRSNRQDQTALVAMVAVILLAAVAQSASSAAARSKREVAGPADPPLGFRGPAPAITSPSIAKGQKAGIAVGDYAPDFQLQPVQPYADLKRWLGDKAPQKAEDKVMLSDFVGKAPILLLFGSYT